MGSVRHNKTVSPQAESSDPLNTEPYDLKPPKVKKCETVQQSAMSYNGGKVTANSGLKGVPELNAVSGIWKPVDTAKWDTIPLRESIDCQDRVSVKSKLGGSQELDNSDAREMETIYVKSAGARELGVASARLGTDYPEESKVPEDILMSGNPSDMFPKLRALLTGEEMTIQCTRCSEEFLNDSDYIDHECKEVLTNHLSEASSSAVSSHYSSILGDTRPSDGDKTFEEMVKRKLTVKEKVKLGPTFEAMMKLGLTVEAMMKLGLTIEAMMKLGLLLEDIMKLRKYLLDPNTQAHDTDSELLERQSITQDANVVPSNDDTVRNIKKRKKTDFILDRHKRKPFTCNVCNQDFKYDIDFKSHSNVCSVKRYACNLCEYKCDRKTCLQRHMRKHTGEKPFACEFANCERMFSDKRYLLKHMRLHDLINEQTKRDDRDFTSE